MSAPRSSGFWMAGERKVLSTTTFTPCLCAIVATARMSTTIKVGLEGDSIQISFVSGRMSSSSSISIEGVNVTFTPWALATWVK